MVEADEAKKVIDQSCRNPDYPLWVKLESNIDDSPFDMSLSGHYSYSYNTCGESEGMVNVKLTLSTPSGPFIVTKTVTVPSGMPSETSLWKKRLYTLLSQLGMGAFDGISPSSAIREDVLREKLREDFPEVYHHLLLMAMHKMREEIVSLNSAWEDAHERLLSEDVPELPDDVITQP